MRSLRLLVVSSLLVAAGLPAALLQGAAWAGMIARNLRHAAPTVAVARALDGAHPCSLCLRVRNADAPRPMLAGAGQARLDAAPAAAAPAVAGVASPSPLPAASAVFPPDVAVSIAVPPPRLPA